jgi:hypothetical protein
LQAQCTTSPQEVEVAAVAAAAAAATATRETYGSTGRSSTVLQL